MNDCTMLRPCNMQCLQCPEIIARPVVSSVAQSRTIFHVWQRFSIASTLQRVTYLHAT